MGVVYKVHDRQLHTDLAVKSPRPEMFAKASGKEDFIREAETWIKLRRHPHVAQCFFVQMVGGLPRLFTEYVDGGSLADYIKERTLYEGGEKTALARMLDLAIQMARSSYTGPCASGCQACQCAADFVRNCQSDRLWDC
jgi:serine/threonine protein kinase